MPKPEATYSVCIRMPQNLYERLWLIHETTDETIPAIIRRILGEYLGE